jgi:magnesium transporter
MKTKNVIIKPYIKLRKLFRKKKPAGLPPGTLVYTGDKVSEISKLIVIGYNSKDAEYKEYRDPDDFKLSQDSDRLFWIDVEGLNNTDTIQNLGKSLNLHPLVMEDILNVDQRPKTEDYPDYQYMVLKMFRFNKDKNEILSEQLSIILSRKFVATFQEGIEGDSFHNIRKRISASPSAIYNNGSDYLLYLLIDSVIDSYFDVLEYIGEKIESLEQELVNNPGKGTLTGIYAMKREMLYLRKNIWPLREAISRLERNPDGLISKRNIPYFRDVYDHCINVIDTMETYREMLTSMIDIYLSSFSNKLNETMKYLALISTIFIPMTFIASIYGMNFENMPELQWLHGYYFALGLMFAVGIGFFIYFKSKKWV